MSIHPVLWLVDDGAPGIAARRTVRIRPPLHQIPRTPARFTDFAHSWRGTEAGFQHPLGDQQLPVRLLGQPCRGIKGLRVAFAEAAVSEVHGGSLQMPQEMLVI